MSPVIIAFVAVAAIGLLALGVWRWVDNRADQAAWSVLSAHQPSTPNLFENSMIAGLPDPAQRFLSFAIRQGTPLYTVAEIAMEGDLSLGSKADPNDMPMRARQILAAPHGFVWTVRAGRLVSVAGSDGASDGKSWSRFWLMDIVPIARAGGSRDHARASFGRYIAEAVFWTPAALLPGDGVIWAPIDGATVRVTVTHGELEQSVDLSVDADGRLTKVVFQRWSDANPNKVFRLQPFGGYLSQYRDFDGFRLPTRIEAGNFFDTDDYFAFFRATVTSVHFRH